MDWDSKDLFEQQITSHRIVAAATRDYEKHVAAGAVSMQDADGNIRTLVDPSSLDPEDVIVSLSPMHYGMGNANPMQRVKFYAKGDLNSKW